MQLRHKISSKGARVTLSEKRNFHIQFSSSPWWIQHAQQRCTRVLKNTPSPAAPRSGLLDLHQPIPPPHIAPPAHGIERCCCCCHNIGEKLGVHWRIFSFFRFSTWGKILNILCIVLATLAALCYCTPKNFSLYMCCAALKRKVKAIKILFHPHQAELSEEEKCLCAIQYRRRCQRWGSHYSHSPGVFVLKIPNLISFTTAKQRTKKGEMRRREASPLDVE